MGWLWDSLSPFYFLFLSQLNFLLLFEFIFRNSFLCLGRRFKDWKNKILKKKTWKIYFFLLLDIFQVKLVSKAWKLGKFYRLYFILVLQLQRKLCHDVKFCKVTVKNENYPRIVSSEFLICRILNGIFMSFYYAWRSERVAFYA